MEYKTTAKLVIQACDKDLPGVFGDGARGSTLTPAGERAIAVYEELQTDINNVIATKANDLIASIKE